MEIKNGILVKPKEYIIRDNEGTPIYIASSKEVGGVIVFIVFFFLVNFLINFVFSPCSIKYLFDEKSIHGC